MNTRILSRSLTTALFAATCAAQSFNVDIHVAPDATPPSTFGGFAPQPGFWNTVPFNQSTPLALRTLQNAADNSAITISGSPLGKKNSGLPADVAPLYNDYASKDDAVFTVTIGNLEAGQYVAVLYSWAPDAATQFVLTSDVTSHSEIVMCPTAFPGYSPGQSLALIPFVVGTENSPIVIDVFGEPFSALNGIQLVRYVGVPGCPQPLNSQGAQPKIAATGTIVNGAVSIAANNLHLHVGLLPGPLPNGVGAILCWASNGGGLSIATPCPDVGTRCIGPMVTRVLDPNSPPGGGGVGLTTGYGTYSVPVDLNAMAAAGLTIAPGAKLHFQMFYRDSDVNDACPNTDSVKRWTTSVEITLF
jgi:hypothetical protein